VLDLINFSWGHFSPSISPSHLSHSPPPILSHSIFTRSRIHYLPYRPRPIFSPSPSFPSPSSPALPSHPLPIEVGPILRLVGERLSSPSESGRSPAAKRFLVHFQLLRASCDDFVTGKTTKNCGFYGILNAVFTFYFPKDFPSQPAESFNLYQCHVGKICRLAKIQIQYSMSHGIYTS